MIRRSAITLRAALPATVSGISSLMVNGGGVAAAGCLSLLSGATSTRQVNGANLHAQLRSSARAFSGTALHLARKNDKTAASRNKNQGAWASSEKGTSESDETVTTMNTSTTTVSSVSASSSSSTAAVASVSGTTASQQQQQESMSDDKAASSKLQKKSTKSGSGKAEKKSGKASREPKAGSADAAAGTSTSTAIVPLSGAVIASGTVDDFSKVALKEDGRDGIVEATIWVEESCYYPILARGRKNVYEHTDDIPKDVKPMFGDTHIWQTREYFEYRRNAESLRYRIRALGGGAMIFICVVGGVAFTRIWIDQPSEVATLRRNLLGHSYGRVLEMAAGQGINIGVYPYAVTDVVLVDSNPQELHILRSRLPRTAYPTYQVVCDRGEELKSLPDHTFDTVVDMFGLCHYKDPVTVLKQMQRVCKPTGTLLLLEHGRTEYSAVNWFLDWRADKHFERTQGCQWNKDMKQVFKDAGLVIRSIETQHYGTTFIVIAHPEVSGDQPLTAGGMAAPAIMQA